MIIWTRIVEWEFDGASWFCYFLAWAVEPWSIFWFSCSSSLTPLRSMIGLLWTSLTIDGAMWPLLWPLAFLGFLGYIFLVLVQLDSTASV